MMPSLKNELESEMRVGVGWERRGENRLSPSPFLFVIDAPDKQTREERKIKTGKVSVMM